MFLGVKEIFTETYPAPIRLDVGVIEAVLRVSAVKPWRVVVVNILDVSVIEFVRAVVIG